MELYSFLAADLARDTACILRNGKKTAHFLIRDEGEISHAVIPAECRILIRAESMVRKQMARRKERQPLHLPWHQ